MAQFFVIHPVTPQVRLIRQAAEIVRNGGVIIYPTDSSYALACRLDDKGALDRIRQIRRLGDDHNFTLVCSDISQISHFARFDNEAFRLMKSLTPGPYTFILKATKDVPRRLQHPKRKTIGIRVPDHPVAQALIAELNEPLFTSTLILPGENEAMSDPYDIRERFEHEVDLIIDSNVITYEPTTILLLTETTPEVIRQGKGTLLL